MMTTVLFISLYVELIISMIILTASDVGAGWIYFVFLFIAIWGGLLMIKHPAVIAAGFLLASLAVMLFGYWLVPHSQQKLITLTLSLGMSVISAFTMIWVLVTGERKPRTKRKPVKKTDATPTGTTAE